MRPETPWPKVRGIGSILRHDYSSLSDRIIWNVVLDELPRLKAAVVAIAATGERITLKQERRETRNFIFSYSRFIFS
jgi:uncharacterized protein with HEPN domain